MRVNSGTTSRMATLLASGFCWINPRKMQSPGRRSQHQPPFSPAPGNGQLLFEVGDSYRLVFISSTAGFTVDSIVQQEDPAVFEVAVSPTSEGDLTLQISQGAEMTDDSRSDTVVVVQLKRATLATDDKLFVRLSVTVGGTAP